MVFSVYNYFKKVNISIEKINYTQFVKDLESGNIKEIYISGQTIKGKYSEAHSGNIKNFETSIPVVDPKLISQMIHKYNVQITNQPPPEVSWWSIALNVLIPLFLLFFILFLIKQAQGGGSQAFSFGRSKAKLLTENKVKVSFKDVAGVDEAIEELKEVVDFLKAPQKYKNLGARIPKGVLLLGAPGTGKTLLGRAIAGEASVPFYYISGSDFVEMFVGVGASVTGDTPVLIRDKNETKLVPIGEFVDKLYKSDSEGFVIQVESVKTLGFDRGEHGFWGYKNDKMTTFNKSAWKKTTGVFRHKVDEIYEIEYLGGKIKTTGDHSVFIRKPGKIVPVEVRNLKKGDVLVELPLNVRLQYQNGVKQRHKILAHQFESKVNPVRSESPWATDSSLAGTSNGVNLELDFWNEDPDLIEKYQYVQATEGLIPQYQLAKAVGVSQMTVSNWQRGVHKPQTLSRKLVKFDLPEKIKVTPELMKLFGFYTAEGRGTNNLEFVFGIHEKELHQECINLMRKSFEVLPVTSETDSNSLKIIYYSRHLGKFFTKYCGNGSHNKHVPEFIWEMPKEYFLAYLEGYTKGDGYITKTGKLSVSSVSKQLILELSWLCAMHGIKVGIKYEVMPEGRVIKNRPLPESEIWALIIGKTTNPFLDENVESPNQFKRAIISRVTKKKYDDFVYDLCGVENEAFFGGNKPILLHNSRVRDLFEQAKKNAPCIIFVDEIDAVGRQRGAGLGGGHDEREQTLNQLLVEMDGFEPNAGVIILAATNRPDVLDPALLRPGRFDRHVIIDKPDIKGRKAILQVHIRGKILAEDVNLDILARRTSGFSGADLENLLNEAALLAARANKPKIEMSDCEEAIDRLLMGPERKSRVISEKEKNITAYHEAGHALLAKLIPEADPVRKVTILPRGMALGVTWQHPTEDKYTRSKKELLAEVTVLMGGRVAEDIVFDEITTGAGNDIKVATDVLKKMVCKYGMSDKLGPLTFGRTSEQVFLGRDIVENRDYSEEIANQIDSEVRHLVDKCYNKAKDLLVANRDKLEKLVETLKEKEILEGEEIDKILDGTENAGEADDTEQAKST